MYFSLVAGCTENSYRIHTCTAASLLDLDKQLQGPSDKDYGEDEHAERQSARQNLISSDSGNESIESGACNSGEGTVTVPKCIRDVCQVCVRETIYLIEFCIDHS